jgi:hypothetical protein
VGRFGWQGHRKNEAIAAAWKRLDKSRRVRGIRQGSAQLGNRNIYGVVEVAERFVRPDTTFQFLARHHRARLVKKRCQYFQGLNLKVDPSARFAELARAPIEFEDPEPRRAISAGLHHPAPR